ncbi:MAG: hypothetical protein HKN00_03290 [Flavobacteriaceae bacterium]|nr:hypothetical protein [Bacteroidia bacterium]MBT8287922.1 hypothetical protein [Bacteroidia bacterium]NNF74185.1 hypothetical protein [Flavobacteriaceae bacterium]NNK73635.1 hypothetical protein [Flavobacteriaceae bacterium]
MKRTILLLAITLLISNFVTAQVKLSDYKYVIVPKQFPFQNEPDEYDLNRLVKYLFEKQGFSAIIEGQTLPDDLISNYCLAMNAELKVGGALRTKAQIFLRDCENNMVFTSAEGSTKVKDFKRAYEMAIRDAFENFDDLNYQYLPNERVLSKGKDPGSAEESEAAKKEIKQLKAELTALKQDKTETISKDRTENVVEKTTEVAVVSAVKQKDNMPVYFAEQDGNSIYYTVVDGDNNLIMTLITSGRDNLFMVKDANAIVYKENGKWFLSEAKDDKQVVSQVNISFQ